MRTHNGNFVQRGLTTMAIGICLAMFSVADANAHDVYKPGYRSHVVHHHYSYQKPGRYPHWLKQNYQFQHWFVANKYRLKPNINWQRRYDIFRYEKSQWVNSQRYKGRVVRSSGYRTYWNKPLPRW